MILIKNENAIFIVEGYLLYIAIFQKLMSKQPDNPIG